MSNAAAPEDVEKLSFEDALDELERITAEMASGNATLDQSVKSYERGAQLGMVDILYAGVAMKIREEQEE